MNELFKELIKRASVLFLVIGILLVVLAATDGQFFIVGAKSFTPIWVLILGISGGLLAFAGIVMTMVEWRVSLVPSQPAEVKASIAPASNGKPEQACFQQLEHSGLTHAFRIPVDNGIRGDRVCFLIEEEVYRGNGRLRLTASSGHSYLHPIGPVWKQANLGALIAENKVQFEVVLESPFSLFAETRALANQVGHNQWEEKQMISQLVELLKYPNFSLRVTSEAITCSVFLTSRAVFFDPYLWAKPSPLERTENNFWVFEFDKVMDPQYAKLDCYGLLERHYDFVYQSAIPLEKFLHKPEDGKKAPSRDRFCKLFKENRDYALNRYLAMNAEFNQRLAARLKG